MIKRIINHYSNNIWQYRRKKKISDFQKAFGDAELPSIISCNCIGGVMSHEIGKRFMSPTINLFMCCEDFIKFCENIEHYLSVEPINSTHSLEWHLKDKNIDGSNTEGEYPIMLLGDLTLFAVHYPTFEEARDKWNERKQRVDMKNIRIIATDRDGATDDLKARFEALPYPRVMFVHKEEKNFPHCFCLKGFESSGQVDALEKDGRVSGKRKYDQFDWIGFLKDGKK